MAHATAIKEKLAFITHNKLGLHRKNFHDIVPHIFVLRKFMFIKKNDIPKMSSKCIFYPI